MFSFDDYKKNFEEMFSKSPINLEDFYKSANEYNSKFSKITFDTFKKNVEVSQAWTKETIGGMDKLVKPQSKPEDYVKVATDFVTEQAQTSPKYMSEFAEIASNSLRITAADCLKFNIIDEIIEEPVGGAHRDHKYISESLKKSILNNLNNLQEQSIDSLIANRNERYLNYLP